MFANNWNEFVTNAINLTLGVPQVKFYVKKIYNNDNYFVQVSIFIIVVIYNNVRTGCFPWHKCPVCHGKYQPMYNFPIMFPKIQNKYFCNECFTWEIPQVKY